MLEYNMTKKYIIDYILNCLYTALNSFKCSVFFKQIKFNQFKILRIVNFKFFVLNFIH